MPGGARPDFADLGLRAEALTHVRNRDLAATDWLVSLGIERDLTGVHMLGVTCAATDGGNWNPQAGGTLVVTLPLWSGETCIDIVALSPEDAAKWWRRTDITPLLGLEEISRCSFLDAPLHIHPNPLAWLRADATGVVILDWKSCRFWLSGVRRFLCHDATTAKRVEHAFSHPEPSFEIKLAEESIDAVA